MDILAFEFEVRLEGRRVNASCQKFQVHNYPQYRVVITSREHKVPVTTFYETAPAKFFWFRLPYKDQEWARTIAEGLKTYIIKNPETKSKGVKI